MIKILEYPDFTNDLPNIRLVEADHIKTAASDNYHPEILDYIRSNDVPRGTTRVIDLALTDFEGFGANNNGDGFWREHLLRDNDYSKLPYFKDHPDVDPIMPMYKSWEPFGGFYYHHLNKDPKLSRGVVRRAVYNKPMHRIELIVDIEKEKAPDIVDMIDHGGFPATSMGFRCWPTGDVCSICQNFDKPFKNRGEYCDHLKYHMMEIMPDGRLIYAINPRGYFFDISFVRRPADRTSYILSKVASEKYDSIFLGYSSENAERLGYNETVLDSVSEKLANKQATVKRMEGEVDAIQIPESEAKALLEDVPEILERTDAAIPNSVLDEIARTYRLKHILATLEQLGIIIKPREFQRIVIVREYGPGVADEMEARGLDISDFLDRARPIPNPETVYSPGDFIPGIARRMHGCGIMAMRSRMPRYLLKRADDLTEQLKEYYESYPIWPVKTPMRDKMNVHRAYPRSTQPNIIINNQIPISSGSKAEPISSAAGSKVWRNPAIPLLGIAGLFLGIKSLREKSELAKALKAHKSYIYPFLAGLYIATAALQSPGKPEKKAAAIDTGKLLSDPFVHALASIVLSYGLAGRARNLREQGKRPNVLEQTYEKSPIIGSLANYVGMRAINSAAKNLLKHGQAMDGVVTDVDAFNKIAGEDQVMALAFYRLSKLSKHLR